VGEVETPAKVKTGGFLRSLFRGKPAVTLSTQDKIRGAVYLAFVARYASLAIQMLTVAILARLLTPPEIGVFSVSLAVVFVAQALRDLGVGNYIVQERDLKPEHLRTALGVALAISWSLAGILFLLAGHLAELYREPGVERVLHVVTFIFLVNPLAIPAQALLARELRFGALTVVEVASATAQMVVSIALAIRGASYMSLAYGQLAAGLARTATLIGLEHNWNLLWPSLREWRRVVSFGAPVSSASLVNSLGNSGPELIIGRVLGFGPVAFYGRAMGLINLFWQAVLSAVMNVATPSFAHARRQGSNLKRDFLHAVELLTGVAWPFYVLVACMALPLIRIAYGSQWDASANLARILCFGGATNALVVLTESLLISTGAVSEFFRRSLLVQATVLLLVSAGAWISLEGAAIGYAVAQLAGVWISCHYLKAAVELSWKELLTASRRSFIVAAGSLPGPLLALLSTRFLGIWPAFAIALAGFGAGAWLAAVWCRHPLHHELRITWRAVMGMASALRPASRPVSADGAQETQIGKVNVL